MFQAVSTESEIEEVERIAREIWIEHYTPIIGIDQVEYMLDNLHSKNEITEDIALNNYCYFLIKKSDVIGYIGLQIRTDELFLSKIYIASSARGLGIGKLAMQFIRELAQKNQLKKISLTVNKNNSGSIAAYLKLGFIKTGEVCVDIGGGYVMDDYQMELLL